MVTERFRLNRGWMIVVIAGLSMVATLPGRTVGLGLIAEPLMADLALSKVEFARHNLFATLIGSVFALLAGRLLDRWGIRVVLSVNLLLLGALVLWMGSTVTAASVLIFLILTRGVGQSALSTTSVTSVGKWFTADRLAKAMAAFSLLVAIGFAAAIVSSQSQIETIGWRSVWKFIGIAVLGLGALSVVLARDSPLVLGEKGGTSDGLRSLRLGEALRSACFWIFAVGMALYGGVLAAVSLFNESILQELGFGTDVFRLAMAALMIGGLIGNVAAALAARRFSLTRVMALSLAILALVLLAYPMLISRWQVIVHAGIYGFCGGVFSVLFFTGFGQAFGQVHLGKIQGSAQLLAVVASALGPWWLAGRQEAIGSWFPSLSMLAPVFAVLALLAWFTKLPQRREPG